MKENYDIDEKYIGGKTEDYLPIEATYMATAIVWAKRSKDPSTQVGACYVNEHGRIISVGYNGTPNSWADEDFPWGRDSSEGQVNTKYPYVIHAEMNGILNYSGASSDFNNSTVYVTLFPCSNCAKFLAQRGIKKIVYLSDKYKGSEDNICSKILLNKCGIEYYSFDELNDKKITGLDVSFNPDNCDNPVKIKK